MPAVLLSVPGASPAGDARPAGTNHTRRRCRRWTRGTTPLVRPAPRARRSDRSVPAVTGRTRSGLVRPHSRWIAARSSDWLTGDGRVDASTPGLGDRACVLRYYRAV